MFTLMIRECCSRNLGPLWRLCPFLSFIGTLFVMVFLVEPTLVHSQSVDAPKGVQRFYKSEWITVKPTDKLNWESRYQLNRFVKMDSREIVVPVLQVKEPRFTGPDGSVKIELVWQQIGMSIGNGHAHICLPKDSSISGYIILLRRLERPGKPSKDAWRIWEFSAKEVWKDDRSQLVFPDYQKLEVLDNRKDKSELLRKLALAEEHWIELSK